MMGFRGGPHGGGEEQGAGCAVFTFHTRQGAQPFVGVEVPNSSSQWLGEDDVPGSTKKIGSQRDAKRYLKV